MFTRCPECLTVFHISAAELRAADGAVVCGECHASFDALATLSETPPADVPRPPAGVPATPPPVESTFEPELEPEFEPELETYVEAAQEPAPEIEPEVDLEAELEPELEPELLYATEETDARDEDDFLQELEALIGPEEPGSEPDFGPPQPPEPAPGPATAPGPAPEPERHAEPEPEPEVEAREDWEPEQELDEASEEDWEDYARDEPAPWGDDDAADLDEPVDAGSEEDREWAREWPEPEYEAAIEEEPDNEPDNEPEPEDEARDEAAVATTVAMEDAGRPARAPGPAEGPRHDEPARPAREPFVGDEDIDPEDLPEFAALQPRRRRWPMVLAALLVLLVVAGAWAHSQRGNLLRHPLGAAILGPVYGALGLEATARWRPGDFQALKWEAGADPAQPERLVVAVEFVNTADFAQPYPVLRVVLEDRFGRRVGSHDVAPSQYLEGYSKGRRLPANARVRTTLEVPDPGARAEGFRIDFCLESGAQGLVCGAEAAP